MKPHPYAATLVLLATAAALSAAFSSGGAAYTKRADTALLSEPKMLAETVAHVPYAKKVKIEEMRGAWLRVSEGGKTGWVFSGNLAETNPAQGRGVDGLAVDASQTSASTAARPLTPVSQQYSERHGLASAAEDLNWLQQQVVITPEEVQAFLQAQKKGEFQ